MLAQFISCFSFCLLLFSSLFSSLFPRLRCNWFMPHQGQSSNNCDIHQRSPPYFPLLSSQQLVHQEIELILFISLTFYRDIIGNTSSNAWIPLSLSLSLFFSFLFSFSFSSYSLLFYRSTDPPDLIATNATVAVSCPPRCVRSMRRSLLVTGRCFILLVCLSFMRRLFVSGEREESTNWSLWELEREGEPLAGRRWLVMQLAKIRREMKLHRAEADAPEATCTN